MLNLVQVWLDWSKIEEIYARDTGDVGFTAHAVLDDVFGAAMIRPFHVPSTRPGAPAERRHGQFSVVGYSRLTADELREEAKVASPVEKYATVTEVMSRPMPDKWATGRVVHLETRVCPTIRMSRGERDAFLLHLSNGGKDTREVVYGRWLHRELEKSGALEVQGTPTVQGFRLGEFLRRPHVEGKIRKIRLPEAHLAVTATIKDGDAFNALLERGVGRHRAFGFGCLLLAHPKR